MKRYDLYQISRSSCSNNAVIPNKQPPEVFYKKGVPKNFSKFTGKHLYQSFFLTNLHALDLQLYLKRYSGTGVFLWILRKFYEHLFLQNTSRRLLCKCVFFLYQHIYAHLKHKSTAARYYLFTVYLGVNGRNKKK